VAPSGGHHPQSDAAVDEGLGTVTGCPERESDHFPGGIRGYGGGNALAARGDVRGVCLGVRGGGCDEGDGKAGGGG